MICAEQIPSSAPVRDTSIWPVSAGNNVVLMLFCAVVCPMIRCDQMTADKHSVAPRSSLNTTATANCFPVSRTWCADGRTDTTGRSVQSVVPCCLSCYITEAPSVYRTGYMLTLAKITCKERRVRVVCISCCWLIFNAYLHICLHIHVSTHLQSENRFGHIYTTFWCFLFTDFDSEKTHLLMKSFSKSS